MRCGTHGKTTPLNPCMGVDCIVTKRESFSENESAREPAVKRKPRGAFKKATRKRQGNTCCATETTVLQRRRGRHDAE